MSGTILRKGVLPLAILALGVVGAVLMMKLKPEPSKRPAMVTRPVVRTHVVDDGTPSVTIGGYGTVRSRQRVQLVPQVTGVAVYKSPDLEAGGVFVSGEVLLRIDEADYTLAVEIASANVARTEYELARAEQEAEIARREWEEIQAGGDGERRIRPNPLVLHGPQLKLAQANLASARASLAKAELDLSRCSLKSPFAGRVVSEAVDVGQYVRAGSAVAEIYASDGVEVTVPLNDADLAFFDAPSADRPGASVEIVADFAGVERVWRGCVVRVAGALNERTRMVDVIVALDEDEGGPALLEGMFVEVRIAGHPIPGAVEVPRSALRDGGVVWTVDDEDALRIKPVIVARKGVETVVISGGLGTGDHVVISQLDVVTEGMLVRVSGRPPAKAGSAAAPAERGERP